MKEVGKYILATFLFALSNLCYGQSSVTSNDDVDIKAAYKPFTFLPLLDINDSDIKESPLKGITDTYKFPLFCKIEDDMYKKGAPISFRLGNLDYVNKLENK